MGVLIGWLLVVAACAPDHPAASQSGRRRAPPALAATSRPNRERRSVADGRPAPAREPRRAEAPSPDTAELEAQYRTRRALSALEGEASYYGDSLAGHRTANGDRYDPRAYTAAH